MGTVRAVRVVRVFHAGRDAAHRERDRALVRAGVDLTLVVPSVWPGDPGVLPPEDFEVVALPITRLGDDNVNRYRFADSSALTDLLTRVKPEVVDLHAEPASAVVHQVLGLINASQPVVVYTAQNLDKRYPPPFGRWERQALGRVQGLYPCSGQAASVAVGKGFPGPVRVLPLAPSTAFTSGEPDPPGAQLRLLLAGRLLAHIGVFYAVQVVAACPQATLTLVGEGPDAAAALRMATELGVGHRVELLAWASTDELAEHYRRAHVVLVPRLGRWWSATPAVHYPTWWVPLGSWCRRATLRDWWLRCRSLRAIPRVGGSCENGDSPRCARGTRWPPGCRSCTPTPFAPVCSR